MMQNQPPKVRQICQFVMFDVEIQLRIRDSEEMNKKMSISLLKQQSALPETCQNLPKTLMHKSTPGNVDAFGKCHFMIPRTLFTSRKYTCLGPWDGLETRIR